MNLQSELWKIFEMVPSWVGLLLFFSFTWGVVVFCLFELYRTNRIGILHFLHSIRIKPEQFRKEASESITLEIFIPKNSQASAFLIQQKIFKALHAIYTDPIKHEPHRFLKYISFVQKLYRIIKVNRSKLKSFNLMIFAEHANISIRMRVPKEDFELIERAIYTAYDRAKIEVIDTFKLKDDIKLGSLKFIAYGQSKVNGKFYHRLRTFKDSTSEPVDSIIGAVDGLAYGNYAVVDVFALPASHYFNQLVGQQTEIQEQSQGLMAHEHDLRDLSERDKASVSDIVRSISIAMMEKTKAILFQTVISYYAIADSREEAENRLRNIQNVLTEVNNKGMNSLVHHHLFTKTVEETRKSGLLENILDGVPLFKYKQAKKMFAYKNNGQILEDSELYSLWHLPNIDENTKSSLKISKFETFPVDEELRAFDKKLFLPIGHSNFRKYIKSSIGIPTWEDAKKHIYLLGGTGSGKTETLKSIIYHALHKTDPKLAIFIIDPKNDFARDVLAMVPKSREEDVIYFNPPKQATKPIGIPFFHTSSGNEPDSLDHLISIMKRFVQIDGEYAWGPELEKILRSLFATANELPEKSLSGLDLLLADNKQINNLLEYLPERLQAFWQEAILNRSKNEKAKYLSTTLNKIGKFLDYPEFMNIADRPDSKISFEEMISSGKIFIANLGSSSDHMQKYLSVFLASKIAAAIFAQSTIDPKDRKPAFFVVDEFQVVASDIFDKLFSQVRAFNTSLVIANQFMGQLSIDLQKSIESNMATKIFMKTDSVTDSEIAEKILGGKVGINDIQNLPIGNAYIKTILQGKPMAIMSMKVDRINHDTENLKDIEAMYVEKTMQKYGTDREIIEKRRQEINNSYYNSKFEKRFYEKMSKKTKHEVAQIKNDSSEKALESTDSIFGI